MTNLKQCFKKRGFTLIETIIYMGIFSTLLIVLSTLFSTIVDQQFNNKTASFLDSDYSFITSRLMYEAQNSSGILTPNEIGDESQLVTFETPFGEKIIRTRNNNLELVSLGTVEILNSQNTTIQDVRFKRLGNLNGRQAVEFKAEISSKLPSKIFTPITISIILSSI